MNTPDTFQLYTYWRSSAAYRVRIGLNLKGIAYQSLPVHLVRDGGEQHLPDYQARNPQELVPTLVHRGQAITQSLAILEYLDDIVPTPALLPAAPLARARVRAQALLVACDIHPLNNLRVLQYLKTEHQADESAVSHWIAQWIHKGFGALEALIAQSGESGLCCHGDTPTLADLCLIPQLYNARRFQLDLSAYPRLRAIEQHCLSLPAFDLARPENQPDAA